MAAKLTAKRERFALEYLIDLNATQAAIRAGYSARTAEQAGHRLLRDVQVSEAIAHAKAKRQERTEITADRVLLELSRIAFFDQRRLYREDGTLKAMHELDDESAAVLTGIEVVEQAAVAVTGAGDVVPAPTFTKKVKVSDKVAALSLAMRHLGMLKDKIEINATVVGLAERLRARKARRQQPEKTE